MGLEQAYGFRYRISNNSYLETQQEEAQIAYLLQQQKFRTRLSLES